MFHRVLCAFLLTVVVSSHLVGCKGGNNGEGTLNPTYTVTYDGNDNDGGSPPVDATRYEQSQIITVLGNSGNLTRAGYSFSGWSMQADGSGQTFAQAQTFAMGAANVTLFARWTAKPTYTVTYVGNGNTAGSVPIDSTYYEQGQIVTVLGNTGNLAKDGYVFTGWNTQPDGMGTNYLPGATYGLGVNILFAQWTPKPTPMVIYQANGATGGDVPQAFAFPSGEVVFVPPNVGNLIRDGYSFSGWNTQADGLGTNYVQGDSFTMGDSNVTLFAKWTLNPTFTVTYDSNGYPWSVFDSTHYETGQVVNVLNVVNQPGLTFEGWNTQADGLGTIYLPGQTFIMPPANVTLYAKWAPNPTYTVTYNGGPVDGNRYEQGQMVTLLGVQYGNCFGWNSQPDGLGMSYLPGQAFVMGAGDVTLYPIQSTGLKTRLRLKENTTGVEKNLFARGETIRLEVSITNCSNDYVSITLRDMLTHDFLVAPASTTQPSWRWASCFNVAQALLPLSFVPWETKTYTETWDQNTVSVCGSIGPTVSTGDYVAQGFIGDANYSVISAESETQSAPVAFRIY